VTRKPLLYPPAVFAVTDDSLSTAWALISQMSAGGKLVGVNWEEVQAQIEAPTKHAA